MNILAGTYRGRKLCNAKSHDIRPCSSRVKKSLFDTLATRLDFDGIAVLDLFAGFGSLGFEALSRGAASVTFVDQHQDSLASLRSTAKQLHIEEQVHVVNASVPAFIARSTASFALLFCDPPYAWADYPALIDGIFTRSLLTNDGIMLMEHSTQHNFSSSPYYSFHKDYGMTRVTFFRKESSL